MLRIRTLGGLDLSDDNEADLGPILRQPKRLALLAYLALHRPYGYHRRETILAALWPEADASHARHSLSQALHAIRRILGEGVVSSRGADELALSASGVWIDAVEFQQLIGMGKHAEALDLYRGPLLNGFYAPGAPQFESWLELERARFHQDAVASALTLSRMAEVDGNLEVSIQWAERLTLLVPVEEFAARHLMRLLMLAGDGAAALARYQILIGRLAADLEVGPSPETALLADEIRRRSAPPFRS